MTEFEKETFLCNKRIRQRRHLYKIRATYCVEALLEKWSKKDNATWKIVDIEQSPFSDSVYFYIHNKELKEYENIRVSDHKLPLYGGSGQGKITFIATDGVFII